MTRVTVFSLLLLSGHLAQDEHAPRDPQDHRAGAWSQEELERVSEEIRGQVEKVRKQGFKHAVLVEIADKPGLLEYLKQRQQAFESPERQQALEQAAKLLGMIPAGLDLQACLTQVIEQQVAGFYDPASKKFYLMRSFSGDMAKVILAHELTHALDDQWYDLDSKLFALADNTDAAGAYHAVMEGSAMYAMQAWMLRFGAQIDQRALAESQALTTGGLEDVPAFVWKPLLASYIQGLGFLMRGDKLDIEDYLARSFASPPRSTEQVLHPDKYWDPAQHDEPRRVELATDALPEGWTVLTEDTLGELYAALLTSPADQRGGLDATNPMAVLGIRYTNDAARGWDGDRLVLFGKGDARVLRMVSVWDTPRDAREFTIAVEQAFSSADDAAWAEPPKRSVRIAPADRTVAAGDDVDRDDSETVVIDVCLGVDPAEAPDVAWQVGADPLAAKTGETETPDLKDEER